MVRFSYLGLLILACLSSAASGQHNWPRFRGPRADGVAPDNPGLPITWTTNQNVKWAADVPGWGWSCPIVWGDRVFLTSVISEEENLTPSKGLYQGEGVREPAKGMHHWMVYCFDLSTGKELWKHEAHSGQPQVPRHPKSTYASETPTTDGERLYVLFGDLGMYCYDLNGKPLWSRKIDPKKTFFDYGAASSPVVHDGQVIVVYDNLEDSWIAAFDATTGDQRWRTARDETHSWATPLIWQNELRTEIVMPGKNRNRSYSLSGELLWEFAGQMSNLVIPSPFAAHGMCYIASGYVGDPHRPTFAIRPGASGELAAGDDFSHSKYIAWYQGTSAPYNPSQIVYGQYLYTLFDRGMLTCHDATSGEEVYGKHRFSPSGSFTASPFAYNGHLFFLSEDGLTYVVKAGPEFEIVARNELDELCIASPAVVGDKLLIRTASKLYCLSEGAQLDAATAARLQPRPRATPADDIWAAAAAGDCDQIVRLLASGVPIDARQPGTGSTPLSMAAVFGQTAAARLLIERGADVSIASADGNTALHIACFFAHTDLVQLLIEKGASGNAKNGRGETPLDVVSAEWSPQLEGFYQAIGNLIGSDLDLEHIKQTRPRITQLLHQQAAIDSAESPDAKDASSPAIESTPRGDAMELVSFSKARTQLHAAVEAGELAGGAHLVGRGGKTVYLEVAGVCDIEDQRPFAADIIVRIYSMTKPITSVAAMTLYEQGKFELDDPVSRFIPAFAETTVLEGEGDSQKIVPAKRPITVRDVFRHTTGFSYGDGPGIDQYYERKGLHYRPPAGMLPPNLTIEQAAEALARIPALHHPGEKFTYGFNTDLLGRLIEIWSGEPFDRYLRHAVLEPLEMVDTGFSVPPDKRTRFASCHTLQDGKLAILDKATSSPFNEGFVFVSGGGGLVSTISDYANFCQMLVDDGKFKERQLLKPETIKLMFTDQLNGAADGFRFGLGFAITEAQIGSGEHGRKRAQYSWGGYASTEFRVVPEAKLFQIFVRQQIPPSNELANRLFPIIYEGIESD